MKTRYKITIVGIGLAITIFGLYQYVMYQCATIGVLKQDVYKI
jgi:hypothetical protein